MSGESVPISVGYLITTTSDWTTFQIMEGGWWSDLHVTCLEGRNKLAQEILYNEKTIVISKNPMDKSKVVVSVKCILNIVREYLQSNIDYLITKGDIESTVVRIIAEGKELQPLINGTNIPNNPKNPLLFHYSVKHYLQALEEKRKAKKVKEKPKEKVEPKKEQVITLKIKEEKHIITETFDKMFKEIFKKKEPSENDIKEIFEWLQLHSENATKFLEADIYRDLTLKAETHFWQFTMKKKVSSEASKTLKKIRNRYDELRKIQGKFAIHTPYLGGVEREEQKIAPKE